MGPLLLARMLELNDVQEGVLNIAFKLADEQELLLIDLKDFRALLQHLGENAAEVTKRYGTSRPRRSARSSAASWSSKIWAREVFSANQSST